MIRLLILFSILSLVPIKISSQCTAGTLYAVNGGSNAAIPSLLYILDPANGSILQTVGNTGFSGIKGIDIHPVTGLMYGIAKPGGSGGGTGQLISIDLNTAVATAIGPMIPTKITDISFDPAGQLYAKTRDGRILIVDITNASTVVLSTCCPGDETGIAINSADQLYTNDGQDLRLVNKTTGVLISTTTITGAATDIRNAITFDNADVLYGLDDLSDLARIDLPSGNSTILGAINNPNGDNMTAISFCPVLPPPVPTLSQWGLVCMGLLLIIVGVLGMAQLKAIYMIKS